MEGISKWYWFRRYGMPILWAGAFIYTLAFALNFRHRSFNGIIWSDAEGYYLYLPAVLLHGSFEDLHLQTNTGQFRKYPGTNKIFDKYTYGVAVLEVPFFLAAHVIAHISGEYPADGYSPPYVYALIAAGLCYAFLGLFFLRLNLREFFPGAIPDLVAFSVLMGTNLLHYAARDPGMSHVYSFFLFNLFIWLTHRYYRRGGPWRLAVWPALVFAWIVLIRPTNVLLGLYFLAYNPDEKLKLGERLQFFRQRLGHLLLFPLFGLLAFFPQMIYWHYMTGSYLFYSYRNEGFAYWDHPKFDRVLFDIRNGWLLFTPLMGMSIIGMISGSVRSLVNSRIILLIWTLALYSFSSWKSWWFGGAFGHRAFIEFYALLAFPLALVVQWIGRRRHLWPKILFGILWILLIYYSLGLDEHYAGPHYDWKRWWWAMGQMFTF